MASRSTGSVMSAGLLNADVSFARRAKIMRRPSTTAGEITIGSVLAIHRLNRSRATGAFPRARPLVSGLSGMYC